MLQGPLEVVALWLHSYIKSSLSSSCDIKQFNLIPAASVSLFVEDFLDFNFKSTSFWPDSTFKWLMWISEYAVANRVAIVDSLSVNCHIITNRFHIIANLILFNHKLIPDSVLLPFYCSFDALKLLWRQQWVASGHSHCFPECEASLFVFLFFLKWI